MGVGCISERSHGRPSVVIMDVPYRRLVVVERHLEDRDLDAGRAARLSGVREDEEAAARTRGRRDRAIVAIANVNVVMEGEKAQHQ